MTVLIAGAGIAGLTMGLTLQQLGIPFAIYESAAEVRPLGVGINLQPNAVRELIDLGLAKALDEIGVRTRQYGFYTKSGREIWVEPRGTWAGYHWPQYSVHRGRLQMLLMQTLIARAGADVVVTGARVQGFAANGAGVDLLLQGGARVTGRALIGADGIHSAIRAQMHPAEGAPLWKGVILWRGVARARPFFGGAAMAMAGHDHQRFVTYPISEPDAAGLCDLNWIAERRVDPAAGYRREDWTRPADKADFAPLFADWRFDWLDVPGVIAATDQVYEYPMVDRDPVDHWTEGAVTLIGDAAHATYPVGSNGASQAIVDARALGAKLRDAPPAQAFAGYEADLRPRMERVILANRGQGPDAVMQMVEDRCGGVFGRIDEVIDPAELAAHAAKYKKLAGFSVEDLNRQAALLGPIVG